MIRLILSIVSPQEKINVEFSSANLHEGDKEAERETEWQYEGIQVKAKRVN